MHTDTVHEFYVPQVNKNHNTFLLLLSLSITIIIPIINYLKLSVPRRMKAPMAKPPVQNLRASPPRDPIQIRYIIQMFYGTLG